MTALGHELKASYAFVGGRVVADGTPAELKAQVARERGAAPTLESVFMAYTGRSLDEDVEEGEAEAAGA